jgi:hypothetical protein
MMNLEGFRLIIKVSFKIDDTEEPELAKWITSFKKKERTRSYHIRQALKAYLGGSGAPLPALSIHPGNPGGQPEPVLVIETGGMVTEKQELSEEEILAKLDSMF